MAAIILYCYMALPCFLPSFQPSSFLPAFRSGPHYCLPSFPPAFGSGDDTPTHTPTQSEHFSGQCQTKSNHEMPPTHRQIPYCVLFVLEALEAINHTYLLCFRHVLVEITDTLYDLHSLGCPDGLESQLLY